MEEIMLYPATVRFKDTNEEFHSNIGYLHYALDVPENIDDAVFWWSEIVPYEGMDMDDAVLVKLDGQPTLVKVD